MRVDGKAEAFTIGEKLNEDMAVVRVEKGNLEIHGIYAFINREFSSREWADNTKYINREEDMGMEGLRKSKIILSRIHGEQIPCALPYMIRAALWR